MDRVRLTIVRVGSRDARGGCRLRRGNLHHQSGELPRPFSGTPYQFTAQPLQRGFKYRVSAQNEGNYDHIFANGTYGYIEIDGAVDQEVSYAYFEPTPFSEWQIKVANAGAGLDLSGVTRIVMEFAGSADFRRGAGPRHGKVIAAAGTLAAAQPAAMRSSAAARSRPSRPR